MIFNISDVNKIIERAKKLHDEGKTDRAIKTLERSLTGNKEDFPLCLELGKYQFENTKFVESATNLKKAYHYFPERWNEIIDVIESSHFAGGTPVETGTLLLEIYIDKKMYEDARKIIDASSKEQVEEMVDRHQAIYKNVISRKKTEEYNRRDILNIYAFSLLQQKIDLKEGLKLYETIFNAFPDERLNITGDLKRLCRLNYGNPYPKFLLGKFLFYDKKYKEGIEHFKRVVELDKNYAEKITALMENIIKEEKNPLLYLQLAKYSITLGKIEKAIAYAKEMQDIKEIPPNEIIKIYLGVIRKEPKNLAARIALAKLYTKEGQYDSVLSELTTIIETNPDKYKEVSRIAEQIIDKDPYNSNLLYFLSDIYIEGGETDKAIASLEKLFKASKELSNEIIGKLNKVLENELENINGLSLLAEIYCYTKRFKEALFIYEHLMDLKDGIEFAEKGITKIVDKNPEFLKAKISLALVAFKKGNHKKSLDLINSVVEKDPSNISQLIPQLDYIARKSVELAPYVLEVYNSIPTETIEPFILSFAKAETYALSKDYKKAVQYYNKCFDMRPEQSDKIVKGLQRLLADDDNIPIVHTAIGKIYLKAEKIKEGLAHLRKATTIDHKLNDKVIHILYQLLKKFPLEPAVTDELLAALMQKGAYEQAISECEDAVERLPKEHTGVVYLMHGQASLEKGLLKQASLSILHALDIDESYAQDALKLLRKADSIDRNNIVVKYGLAKALIAAKEYSEAAFAFYDITKSDPTKIEKAIQELRKIVKFDRLNPDIHFSLGSLYLTEKRVKDAMEEFRATSELSDAYIDKVIGKLLYIEKHHPNAKVYLYLGKLYVKKKMFTKATHYLTSAYRKGPNLAEQIVSCLHNIKTLDPKNYVVLYTFAEIAQKSNDIDTAIKQYDEILKIIPEELQNVMEKVEVLQKKYGDVPEFQLFLSKILSLDKKIEKSIEILKTLIEEHPDKTDSVLERLKEMSEQGIDEARLTLIEHLLKRSKYEGILQLLKKTESNFSFHTKIIALLKSHLEREPNHLQLILYLSRFLYFRDNWKELKEIVSKALTATSEESATSLLIFNYLILTNDGKPTQKIKSKLKETMGQKKFYFSIQKLERDKKEFQLKRLEFAIKKSPELSSLKFEIAELLNKLGRVDETIKLLSKPFKDKKDQIIAKYITAKSFFLKNNPVRTIEILRSISLPYNRELKNKLLLLLSSSYEKIGDYKSAVITLENCEIDINIEKRITYLDKMVVDSVTRGGIPIISG